MNQPLPLVEQLKSLEHLQELDLKIDALKKDKNSLPSNLKLIDDSLQKLDSSLSTKKNLAIEAEKVSRQTQAALELNRDRLSRSTSKLEAVQNTQEFQAASKEIDQLKKLNVTLEEQLKKSDADLEVLKKSLAGIESEMKGLQDQRNAQETELLGQDDQFTSEIDHLLKERAKYSGSVETRTLAQYDRVRGARGGVGIVPTVSGRCKGCNMMVPPQLYNEVQRGSTLHSCPSCHRLLYVPVVVPGVEVDLGIASHLKSASK